jgi:hypothetical protein
MTTNLMQRTATMLKADERSTFDIAKESKLPFYWLRKFRSGAMKNPSVNRVQKLYEHLTGRKLLHA